MPENYCFDEQEIVTIENLLVKLQEMIPNETGENTEILDEIVTAQNIIGAKLDPQAAMTQDSSST